MPRTVSQECFTLVLLMNSCRRPSNITRASMAQKPFFNVDSALPMSIRHGKYECCAIHAGFGGSIMARLSLKTSVADVSGSISQLSTNLNRRSLCTSC
jgi:hypothetical protein